MPTKDRPKSPEVQTPGNVAVRRQQSVNHRAAKPTIEGRRLPGNIYVPPKKPRTPKGALPAGQVLSLTGGFADNTASGAPDIVELARALKNDVDLIYEFVHDNIEFIPTFGSQKGALGALIDGYGNSFDQAELMIELLREAGYTASFQFGELEITAAQAADWFGNDAANLGVAATMLSNGGIPNEQAFVSGQWKLRLSHCWVKVDIGGTYYHFDPAKKSYTVTSGVNLESAMGYSRTSFMSGATSGATVTANYVEDLNRTNVRNQLATLTDTLSDWFKANMPAADLAEVLGGRSIVAAGSSLLRQTSLPYLRPATSPDTWTDIPNAYKVTFSVLYDAPHIDVSFYSKDIHGKRLTITFNGNREAELRLDGDLIATSSAQAQFSWNSVLLSIVHPYPTTFADQSFWQTMWADHPYLIAQAFGNAGRNMIEVHRRVLAQNRFDGGAATDENVIGEALATWWHTWNAEKSHACDVFNRMTACKTVLHHQVGLVGHFDTPTMDLGGIIWASTPLDFDWDKVDTNDTALAMHGIAFEAGSIEQSVGINGISSTTIIDDAVATGLKIYDAKTANWSGTVRPALTNYATQTLDDIQNIFINAGWRVCIPEDGAQTIDDFVGYGYYGISPWYGALGIFSGYLQGGMGSNPITPTDMGNNVVGGGINPNSPDMPQCADTTSVDPIDLTSGSYLYKNTDVTTGSGSYPYSLSFERSYTSGARLADGPLGLGWSHNWNHSIRQSSDGLLAMASGSPLSGVAGLVSMFVTVDLYRDLTKPIDKWVTVAVTNRWLLDQSRNNTAIVSLPGDTQFFVRKPDGSYEAPEGAAVVLVKNVGGDWTYTNKFGVVSSYDSAGKITEIEYPYGVTITFNYTTGKLTSVTNGMRTLTFTYTGNHITGVVGAGQSVDFAYTSNNLTTVTDQMNEDTVFVYDAPGRMTQIFRPANPAAAIVTNVYDALNRVKQQTDGSSNVWTYYLAGSRSEEKDPLGNSRVFYFDNDGHLLREIDQLGNEITQEFDGLGRLVTRTLPEGNSRTYEYDENSNVVTITDTAKAGSGLSDIVQTFTYDPDWNKIATAVDGRGNTTTYTYDGTTGQLLTIQYPAVGGVNPTETLTYNGRGQLLTRTDPEGKVTTFAYHATLERMTQITEDSGGGRLNLVTTFDSYSAEGDVTAKTDPRGEQTSFSYDDCRRLLQITPPTPFNSQLTKFEYNENGNKTKTRRYVSGAGGGTVWQDWTATYTVDGLLASITDPNGNTISYSYNSLRKQATRTDADSRVTTLAYDDAGRLETVTNPLSVVAETRTFTDNGLIASVKDGNNNVTTFEYDGFDRLKKRIFADSTYEQYTRDANGNVTTRRTRKGDSITNTYDALNRLSTKAPAGMATATYTYDKVNRLRIASTPTVGGNPQTGDFEWTYDTAGRLISEEYPDGKTVQYQLDANGNVTRLTFPDSYYVERVYDEVNQLTAVKLNGSASESVSFDYDNLFRRTLLTYLNGNTCGYGYESNNDMSSLAQTFNGSAVEFNYAFNNSHEPVAQLIDNNSYQWKPAAAGTTTYATANNLNEYPTVGGASQTYDNNGCLTGDGVWTFGYDTESRLVSASKSGVSASYVYDPVGRQAQKTVGSAKSRFIYAGFQRIADYDQSGSLVARYVYGASLDEPLLSISAGGTVTYLHHDRKGNIVATTDNTGAVTNSYAYSPWGESASMSGTTIGFTGQRYDSETGLYYFKNRYYSPVLGRFLQPDPALYVDSLNLYEYAHNSPLVYTDPYGLAADGGEGVAAPYPGNGDIAPMDPTNLYGVSKPANPTPVDGSSGCACSCSGDTGGGASDGSGGLIVPIGNIPTEDGGGTPDTGATPLPPTHGNDDCSKLCDNPNFTPEQREECIRACEANAHNNHPGG